MAAAVYRLVGGGDNPIQVSRTTAVETSRQVQSPLLCSSCEQRFNSRGEAWTARYCWRLPNSFLLHDVLSAGKPIAEDAETRVYRAKDFPDLHVEKFVYFALSTFWRAAVHKWTADPNDLIDIGEHEPSLRRYLLDEGPLPTDIALAMMVSWSKADDMNQMMTLPYFAGPDPVRKYKFDIPGISFTLMLGPGLPGEIVRTCTAHVGIVTVCKTTAGWRLETARAMVDKAEVKGKLRNKPGWQRR